MSFLALEKRGSFALYFFRYCFPILSMPRKHVRRKAPLGSWQTSKRYKGRQTPKDLLEHSAGGRKRWVKINKSFNRSRQGCIWLVNLE